MQSLIQFKKTTLLCLFLMLAAAGGARTRADCKTIPVVNSIVATQAATGVVASPAPAQGNFPSADGELKLVVALFRHGVRAPLQAFATRAGDHSKGRWPDLEKDWGVGPGRWGDLTPHGIQALKALGAYYGSYYLQHGWPQGFKAYLWADSADERTRETANALDEGLRQRPDVDVKVEFLKPAGTTDPLFHPFTAMCGTPDPKQLQQIVDGIKNHYKQWLSSFKYIPGNNSLNDLYNILACNDSAKDCKQHLREVEERASVWSPATATPTPTPASPIKWEGQLSYASSATEAFLLEFANGMDPKNVGWGTSVASFPMLLTLHEFYFDKTERETYLAGIKGSNLVREILDQLNRSANYNAAIDGECPRAIADDQFVGLVGHDTNLANVGALLHVGWSFKDTRLPSDILNFPANDALPGGALVFELRQRGPSDYWVDIEYVTQSLTQMRDPSSPGEPFHIQTTCRDNANHLLTPCKMTLKVFNDVVGTAIKNYDQFLSGCQDNKQVCPKPSDQTVPGP